ncbi:MAG: glycosyltransferase family 2 protein [Candidatus Aenigmarchaeota archaeon]|nr:glycosyltransferase family 2 protein [Candidatus Aenigmarchaeota archaeon]
MHIVLVPTYNEEENIKELITRLKKIPNLKPIVVDDGSSDSTADIVKNMELTLISHNKNKGKAEAIKTGFKYILKNYPQVDYVVILDADMQYYPEDATKLIKSLENGEADFVTGYRNWSIVPFRHNLGNFVWRTAFNLLFGTNFKDTNCGYMALTKKSMKIMGKILHGGYILENAMFVEAIKRKLRIKQVPVRVVYNEKRGVVVGSRVVLGLLLFILEEGFKYRLGIK